MSPSNTRTSVLDALHELTGPAAVGGHHISVLSINDDLSSAKFLIYPRAGLGGHRYVPRFGYATARVLTSILAKRTTGTTHPDH